MSALAKLKTLHETTRAAASLFTSYNFRNYFVRRTDTVFAPALAAAGGEPDAAALARAKAAAEWSAAVSFAKTPPPADPVSALKNDAKALEAFIADRERELAQIKRSAAVNAMFGGDKLVVEMPENTHS